MGKDLCISTHLYNFALERLRERLQKRTFPHRRIEGAGRKPNNTIEPKR